MTEEGAAEIYAQCVREAAELKERKYTRRELEIAYVIGLFNRHRTMDELSEDIKGAKDRLDLLIASIDRGDYNPTEE